MNEPGKFVKLHKVQSTSKNVTKKKHPNKTQKKPQINPNKTQKKPQINPNKTQNKQPNSVKKNNNKQKAQQKKKLREIVEKSDAAKANKVKEQPKAKPKENLLSEKKLGYSEDLADRLKASRFRFMNEELYTVSAEKAIEVFNDDNGAFHAYHDGYRKQVEQWPMNPLDRIIKSVKKLPPQFIIADFGCGEARLSTEVQQKCYNFDLVAANETVIAGNMANTPLSPESVNVAVFCLSLMGTNLQDFLLEANRVLKIGGHLKIAEIESRFDDVNEFIRNVKELGFDLITKDISTKVFYFLYFKKVKNVSKSAKFSLKPCLYKKR